MNKRKGYNDNCKDTNVNILYEFGNEADMDISRDTDSDTQTQSHTHTHARSCTNTHTHIAITCVYLPFLTLLDEGGPVAGSVRAVERTGMASVFVEARSPVVWISARAAGAAAALNAAAVGVRCVRMPNFPVGSALTGIVVVVIVGLVSVAAGACVLADRSPRRQLGGPGQRSRSLQHKNIYINTR